jgi:hypothetical protein
MRRSYFFVSGLLALTVAATISESRAQFPAPVDALQYEDTGTLEGVQENYIKFRDSKNEEWILQVSDATKVSVSGEAEAECVRPGFYIRFTSELDKKGALTKDVEEIEIYATDGKPAVGLFAPGAGDAPGKQVRTPNASGAFVVQGRVTAFRDGQLAVNAGGRRITGNTSKELKVKLSLEDASLAQAGDEVKVKAWYYEKARPVAAFNQPGRALAEEVTITLAKPLAYAGKKAKTNDKSAKSPGKSSRVAK